MPDASPRASPRARALAAGAAVILAAAGVYLPVLAAPQADRDGPAAIDHPRTASFAAAVSREGPEGFFPLANVTLWADRAMAAGGPGAFLRSNLCLHVLASLLAYMLAARITSRVWAGMAVGLAFGANPLGAMHVSSAAGRETLLAACFALGSALAFARGAAGDAGRGTPFAWAAAALYACACLSGPHAVWLPVALLGIERVVAGRGDMERGHAAARWGPFAAVGLAAWFAFGWSGRPAIGSASDAVRLLAAGQARAARPLPGPEPSGDGWDARTGLPELAAWPRSGPRSAAGAAAGMALLSDRFDSTDWPLGADWAGAAALAGVAVVLLLGLAALRRSPVAWTGLLWLVVAFPWLDHDLAAPLGAARHGYLAAFGAAMVHVSVLSGVVAGAAALFSRPGAAAPPAAQAAMGLALAGWLAALAAPGMARARAAAGAPPEGAPFEESRTYARWDPSGEELDRLRSLAGRLEAAGAPRGWPAGRPFHGGLTERQAAAMYTRLGLLEQRGDLSLEGLARARAAWSAALAVRPDHAEAALLMADACPYADEAGDAGRLIDACARAAPGDWRAQLAAGRRGMDLLDLDAGPAAIERAWRLAPGRPEVYAALEEARFRARAIAAAGADPRAAAAEYREGAAAFARRDWRRAERGFTRAMTGSRHYYPAAAFGLAEARLRALEERAAAGPAAAVHQLAADECSARGLALQARPDSVFFAASFGAAALRLDALWSDAADPAGRRDRLRDAIAALEDAALRPAGGCADVHALLARLYLAGARDPEGLDALRDRGRKHLERASRLGYNGAASLAVRVDAALAARSGPR